MAVKFRMVFTSVISATIRHAATHLICSSEHALTIFRTHPEKAVVLEMVFAAIVITCEKELIASMVIHSMKPTRFGFPTELGSVASATAKAVADSVSVIQRSKDPRTTSTRKSSPVLKVIPTMK